MRGKPSKRTGRPTAYDPRIESLFFQDSHKWPDLGPGYGQEDIKKRWGKELEPKSKRKD